MGARLFIAVACGAGLAVAPPAVAGGTPPGGALTIGSGARGSPAAALLAVPARPVVGQPVRLSVAAPPSDAGGFAWDLTGRGVFERHTGGAPHTETRFAQPGVHTVAVRFRASGRPRLAVLTVVVAGRPDPRHAYAPGSPAARRRRHRSAAARRRRHRSTAALSARITAHGITAQTAGDPGVTVADFHFSPASTTIHVGDTITWTNDGPSSHTATARNGGFDTGILKKGQSASHTFTQAGTFTYFCQIHPFMHGTIVVLAASTRTTAATMSTPATTTASPTTASATAASASSPTATTAATTTAQTGPALPNTGFNVAAGLGAGLLLLGAGAALRRARPR